MRQEKHIIAPYQKMRHEKIVIPKDDKETLVDAIARALTAKKPSKEDLDLIRKCLIKFPEFSTAIFDAAGATQAELLKKMAGGTQEVVRMAGEEHLAHMRVEMGYHDAPMLERILIENIITCWLRLQHYEQQLAFQPFNAATVEFWEKRLTVAQRRYLAACETLAKISKMKIPALQVNIGEKQVNVAGNLQAPKPSPEVINK